jgi:FtsX-like permease family
MTTLVAEQTSEIGIMKRAAAADRRGLPQDRATARRARGIRRIFATETLTLALAGWLIGIPVGYLLDWFLVWMVKTVLNQNITLAFPPWNLALTLTGTLLLALWPGGRRVREGSTRASLPGGSVVTAAHRLSVLARGLFVPDPDCDGTALAGPPRWQAGPCRSQGGSSGSTARRASPARWPAGRCCRARIRRARPSVLRRPSRRPPCRR